MTKDLQQVRDALAELVDWEHPNFEEHNEALATLDSIMAVPDGYVMVPIATLKHWRELVDLNPKDLAPRMDNYILPAAPKHGGEI